MERSKCSFLKDTVKYVGYRVDAKGIQATQEKIAAIERAYATECSIVEILFRPFELLSEVFAEPRNHNNSAFERPVTEGQEVELV
jgi:hypothetical protein